MTVLTSSIDYLKRSPMFQLSLTSKELFHSNFVSWVVSNYMEACSPVFSRYVDHGSEWTISEVKREEGNKDITIYFRNEDGQVKTLIIENKVKSLPNYEQLSRYTTADPSEHYVLLSLVKPTFTESNKVYIPEFDKEWTCISYLDLAQLLEELIPDIEVKNSYHANIIRDYIRLASSLHEITEDIVGEIRKDTYNYYRSTNSVFEQLREVRLHDFFLKLKHEMMAVEFYKEMSNRLPDLKFVPAKRWEDARDGEVFVSSGFTNGSGISEVKYVIGEKNGGPIILGIQIQALQFRLFVEGDRNISFKTAERLLESNEWYDFSMAIGLGVTEETVYPKSNKPFNTYSQTFFYQYTKIQECQIDRLIKVVADYIEYVHRLKQGGGSRVSFDG
ncbi:PD-(D/E)XK nuclease family protein [Pseudoneobacillus sp. C159]